MPGSAKNPTRFCPATSPNGRISPQNVLNFSFDPFATLP